MIQIADGFEYKGNKPLDSRLKYATITEMVAVPVANLYDGCEAYVTATKKYYSYDSSNEVDETLGKWRERASGGSGGTTDYADLSNKPSINGVTLSGNKTASDLELVSKAVNDLVNYYTKTQVDDIVTAIKNSRFEVVSELPTEDIKTNVIYLVPRSTSKRNNVKDEYINLDGTSTGWESIGSTSIDLADYVTTEYLNTVLEDYVTSTDLETLLATKQDKIQQTSMPTASEDLEGAVYQYLGATTSTYTHGHWYECVSDGEDPATYSWVEAPNYEVMDDSDMDDVVTPLPSVRARYHKYSTEEQVVGEWINGKPLYERTIDQVVTTHTTGGKSNSRRMFTLEVSSIVTDLDTMISALGYIDNIAGSSGAPTAIGFPSGTSYGYGTNTHLNYLTGSEPDGSISFASDESYSITSVHFVITVQYTKTTD